MVPSEYPAARAVPSTVDVNDVIMPDFRVETLPRRAVVKPVRRFHTAIASPAAEAMSGWFDGLGSGIMGAVALAMTPKA